MLPELSVAPIMSEKKRLFDTLPVDPERIAKIVADKWNGYELGASVKISQNHTYKAMNVAANKSTIVRITPDESGQEYARIRNEIHLIRFLHKRGLKHVCQPIAVTGGDAESDDSYVVRDNDLTLVMFEFAAGEAVNFADWKWISDPLFARTWGRWLAQLHVQSLAYAQQFPDHAASVRNWDELHDSILKGAAIDDSDAAAAADSLQFGVLHGDLNISNFFWQPPSEQDPEFGVMHVFDWDQAQRGWFMWDVSVALYFPFMLSFAGKWIDGSDAPGKDQYERFADWIVQGYETVQGAPRVDRPRLHRMVLLRREFYSRFCRRALDELNADPEYEKRVGPMRYFMQWVVDAIDRDDAAQKAAAASVDGN